jgi:cbb3-type cytochrome oxidase maturation protein
MSVIYVVMPIAFALATGAVISFVWAARRGQFDDLETPRWRVLFDDTPDKKPVVEKPAEPSEGNR